MTHDHIGDDAEFYALGLLDEPDANAVESSVASCEQCAERVRSALRTVASLADALPGTTAPPRLGRRISLSVRAPRRPVPGLLAAAVVAAAFIGLGANDIALRARSSAADVALATIAGSHFQHVTATAKPGSGVVVKILYARDGSWLFAIATGADRGSLRVIERDPGPEADLGSLVTTGESASLFVRPAKRANEISIVKDGRDIATARLRY